MLRLQGYTKYIPHFEIGLLKGMCKFFEVKLVIKIVCLSKREGPCCTLPNNLSQCVCVT